MNKRILGMVTFLALLCLYFAVLTVLAPFLPHLGLAVLILWMIIRRPQQYPDRAEKDLDQFVQGVAETLRRLLEMLLRPLVGRWP